MDNQQTPTKVLNITPNAILLLEQNEGKKTTRLIPANTFNTLKYVLKGAFEGLVGLSHTKIYLGDNCVISPTTQEYVLKRNGANPLQKRCRAR